VVDDKGSRDPCVVRYRTHSRPLEPVAGKPGQGRVPDPRLSSEIAFD
jgi:hypothetical protein